MSSVKVLGPIVLTALMTMALVGASLARAETTQLCKADESTCAEAKVIKHLHEETLAGVKAKLLNSIGTVECNVLFLGDSLGSGAPLVIHGHFTYSECKRSKESCTLTEVSTDSLLEVLKESHETAKETIEGEVQAKCGFFLNCKYNGEGLKGTVKGPLLATSENGEVTVSEQALHKVSGALCPETAKLDIATMPLEKVYLASGGEGSSKKSTSLTTSLKGGGKGGAEITVSEGTKVKDTATLSGENASKATGTVKYKVYSDSKCKELVTNAGEVTVKEGKVPDSEEKELEAGALYYWQAEYGGNSSNEPSTSTCGNEILTVKAKTTLTTKLSGGGKEGEEITVAEGSKVKDQATLSGTKSSTATGTIKYAVYKDNECKELATKAGEGEVKEGIAPASEEKELEAGAVYYWQAEYSGDSLHEALTSTCSKEVETVKAKVTLSTELSDEEQLGEEIEVQEESAVSDTATLSGKSISTATGTVKYFVYSDEGCEELETEAGKVTVKEGKVPASEKKKLKASAVYYWRAEYSGDETHEAVVSACGDEVETVAEAVEAVQSEWMVEGETLSELKLSEEEITLVSKPVSLLVPSIELTIECKKVEGEGEITQEGGEEFEAKLTECAAVGSEACKVEPMVVGVKTELIYAGGSFYDAIRSSKKGVPLTKVIITGEKCSLPKESTVKGSYAAEVSQEEEEEPPLAFSKGISEAVNEALKSEGKTKLSLTFGEKSAVAYFTGAIVPPVNVAPRPAYRRVPFTRLCKRDDLPRCRDPWIYPKGTLVKSENEEETRMIFGWGNAQTWEVVCSTSIFEFEIKSSGGSPLLATSPILGIRFACQFGCGVVAKDMPYAVEVIATSGGGEVIVKNPRLELSCFLGEENKKCVYGAKEMTFAVTGSAVVKAKMKLALVNLQKINEGSDALCTQAAVWEQEEFAGELVYEITEPDPELGNPFFITM
jgi:hypothetical protein